jgi:hypothetical protein
MKTLSVILVAVLLFTTSWNTPAETIVSPTKNKVIKTSSGEEFSFFRIHRQGKGVTSTWGLFSNSGVTEFIVQQTYEDITDPYAYWADVATISCTSSRSFKHTDETVFPGFVSYRIVAMNGLTVVDVSEVLTIHIVQH